MRNVPRESPASARDQDALWSECQNVWRENAPVSFDEVWSAFRTVFANRKTENGPPPAWKPRPETVAKTNLGRFMTVHGFASYEQLHRWSVQNREAFWSEALETLGVVFEQPPSAVLDLGRGVKDPCWLPGARMNCVDSCFKADAGKVAVIAGAENRKDLAAFTYRELERLANRVAAGLIGTGYEPDDAIALCMPMNFECVAAYLGIVKAGCRVVSIADSFSAAEVRERLEISKARGIVTVQQVVRRSKKIQLYEKIREAAPCPAVVIPSGERQALEMRGKDILWKDLLADGEHFPSCCGDPYRVTNILFSSGTTGTPKAIPWTHLTPLKCAMDGHFHQDIQDRDVIAWPTSIGWMMGPWLIYASLMNNAAMALYEGVPTDRGFIDFVREAGVTVLGVTPSLVRRWRSSREAIDWGDVRIFSSTGEPSAQEDYLWLMSRARFNAPIIEYCGGTEIGGGHVTGTPVQPASPATFTTPALGIDLAVLDDEGRPVAEGEMGEVFVVPPSIGLSQTLLNQDHEQVYYEGCPQGPNGETLRRHGDQMTRMHKGFFKAQGRADDTMNLGGIKVSCMELEGALNAHPSVCECAAVCVQAGGEGPGQLIVFAVLAREIDPATLKIELARILAERLNPLFKITALVVEDALPRTASNKLMRRVLRDRYVNQASSGC